MSDRVTVVVVNYDGGEDVLAALRSVRDHAPGAATVVVDNASRDGSPDRIAAELPETTLIRNQRNVGFGAAANQGAGVARTPFVLFLNADAALEAGAVDRLVATLDERPRAAVVGPLVLNPDGSVQPSKRAFPSVRHAAMHGLLGLFWTTNPGSRAYLLMDADLSRPTEVDWVVANSILVRRDAFESVDGFDEAYFFFVEDVDLCRRLRNAGWSVWFEPRARVVHAWGASWQKRPLRFLWLHHVNLFRYVRKHRRGAWVLAYPAILAGLGLRFGALALRWLLVRRAAPVHRRTKEATT